MLFLRLAGVTVLAVCLAAAQSAPPLSFDVASVKPAAPCCAPGQWRESKALEDRIDFRYVTLKYCVAFAYRLKEYQVSGPQWINEVRYDIVAKGAAGTKRDQLPDMVRQLLLDRFKLQAHHEIKEFSVYVITIGKNGPKLTASPADAPGRNDGANVGIGMENGVGTIHFKHGTMTSLANTLVRIVGTPVLDKTGLTDVYDFDLEFAPEDAHALAPLPPGKGPAPAMDPSVSVFSSIQKLGLKLENQKPPQDAIVVDTADKSPIEN